MLTRFLTAGLTVALLGAAIPVHAQPTPQPGRPPGTAIVPPTAGIAPEAAAKVVQIMTEYTMAVGLGFAGGGLLASIFTERAAAVLIGGVTGAVVGNFLFGQYVRAEYGGRYLGEN